MSILSGFTKKEIIIIKHMKSNLAIDFIQMCYGLRTDQAKEVKKQADAKEVA